MRKGLSKRYSTGSLVPVPEHQKCDSPIQGWLELKLFFPDRDPTCLRVSDPDPDPILELHKEPDTDPEINFGSRRIC
jgi:hypothetical protein